MSAMLSEDSFFDNDMRTIYRYIAKTAKDGDKPDLVAVGQRLSMSMAKEEASRLMVLMATCGDDLHGNDTTIQQDVKVLEHYRQQRLYLELGERLTYSADRMLPEELSDILLDYQQRLVSADARWSWIRRLSMTRSLPSYERTRRLRITTEGRGPALGSLTRRAASFLVS